MPALAAHNVAPDWIGFGFCKTRAAEFAYTPDAFITALAEFSA